MAITKLVAGTQGDPSNSTGSDIKNAVNALIDNVSWVLNENYNAPVIIYAGANVQINDSGSILGYVTGGNSATLFEVTTGTLPPEFSLDSVTGVITYTTTSQVSSGSFGITASNPSGDSAEYIINWSIEQANGRSEFTNSEALYPFVRVTTSKSSSPQIMVKQSFHGVTTGTSNGTIVEDSSKPIYAASNGDATWNYLISPNGYTYWVFYLNSQTDPASLSNGVASDMTTSSLGYDLVAPTSQDVNVQGVNYPSDQTDVHYGTGLKYLSLGSGASLNGFLSDDNSWSYGFRSLDEIPRDGLGRTLFTREGRNWNAFYIGHNDTYTNMLVGNGSNRTYDGDDLSFPPNGIPAGSYIRVTFDGNYLDIYVGGTKYFRYTPSSYWDSASSVNSLNVLFGKGVESNAEQTSYTYSHGQWQGNIDRMWIANGVTELSDDNGLLYPSGTTHSWDMVETQGNTFASSTGAITMVGI